MKDIPIELIKKLKQIRLVIFDVDGVFTDDRIYINDRGEEMRAFNLLDGLGVKLLLKAGIEVAIISAKNAVSTRIRMENLGVQHLYLGFEPKLAAYDEVLQKLNFSCDQVAYVGNDLPDLALMQKSALGLTVKNAHPFILKQADWITTKKGGKGAVREICDWLLDAQGKINSILQEYRHI